MSRLIETYLDQLLNSLKYVTPPIDPDPLGRLYIRGDYAAMLGWIKNSMQLNLRVGLRIVDSGAPAAPMWIETPHPMPTYGTPEFERTRVVVNVRRELLETKPFIWIVAGFAHELSHIVLFSIAHPLQYEEKAVDLTAMILGYPRFIADAENTSVESNIGSLLLTLVLLRFGILFWRSPASATERLGYLSRQEALFAWRYLADKVAADAPGKSPRRFRGEGLFS